MEHQYRLVFGPFCLDATHGRLWRGEHVIALRPRSLAVLRYLAEHPGRLVTKAELQQQVWAGTHVSASVLRVSITEIRAALGDSATAPRYVETVGQQGYRFLAWGDMDRPPPLTTGPIVGRQHDVALLEQWLQDAAGGSRRLGFVSGDVGLGKTTVVDLLLVHLAARSEMRSARGQCVEHYGVGEPYLALLEAVGQLCRGPGGQETLAVLRRYAPMWLVQFPELVSELELERLQRQVHGATPARMLRVLSQALEVLTTDTPLVLVLEDLHWSDPSTVECLAYLAQRREPARLLVLGTYRPAEAVIRAHPLRRTVQELCGRGQAVELCLERLRAEDVAAYVAGRLAGPVAAPLAAFVHARTDGHALFMTNIVEHLVHQGLVVRRKGQWTLRDGSEACTASLPEGLRQLLVRRLEELPPEAQQVLETASVVGDEFAVAAVAAGAQCTVEEVEAVCEGVAAHHHLIDDTGLAAWPDGTRGGRYRFRHVLYQQVLYERLGTARRRHLHRRIGARLATGYGARAREIASQLAVHFERGGEAPQAVHAWQQAGEQALRRFAYAEAIGYLRRGLTLLEAWAEGPERWQQELAVQIRLGTAFLAARGYTAPETEQAFRRALVLSLQLGEHQQTFPAQHGLFQYYYAQGRHAMARAIAEQLLHLARASAAPADRVVAHRAMGAVLAAQGEFSEARWHVEQSLALYTSGEHEALILHYGLDFQVFDLSLLALVLWCLGFPDQARQLNAEAIRVARALGHSFSQGQALNFAVMVQQCSGDVPQTRELAEALIAVATEHGFPLWRTAGQVFRGWALAAQGQNDGATQLQQAIAAYQAMGLRFALPYGLALVTSLYGCTGRPEVGLATLAEALDMVESQGEYMWQAELFRLKGELLLVPAVAASDEAEHCFQQALAIARAQHARSWELRAATSLARLWQQQGKHHEAHQVLTEVYGWFIEGFATADLQAAQALLHELREHARA